MKMFGITFVGVAALLGVAGAVFSFRNDDDDSDTSKR